MDLFVVVDLWNTWKNIVNSNIVLNRLKNNK